ncbi:MAG: hypothetical protein EBQ92_02610 [Proteobacteria bacterium]|nr:hypothetical protein [Pseudomonadota bacterium]
MKPHLVYAALFLATLLASGCGMRRSSKDGPSINMQALNLQTLRDFRLDRFSQGPQAYLVIPNPIDSPQLKSFDFSPSAFQNAQVGVGLPGLQTYSALDNSFLKIRVHSLYDNAALLVKPQELTSATSNVQDPKYSQVMAYHAVSSISDYVKALGFSLDQSRQLYVMVRSNTDPEQATTSQTSKEINAYYVHNTYQPQKPRYIQLFGDVQYPLGADRDVYWHEFGHLFNESISASRGIDDAGEKGATFTEAGAIHECLADYLSETASQKGYIGRWAARNLSDIKANYPLRAAISLNDSKNRFSNVATYQSTVGIPEKYDVAEWCTRVLWDIRSQFEKENKETGAFYSDRTIFAAVGMLKKNASLVDFKNTLLDSDRSLNGGSHGSFIQNAFIARGFPDRGVPLSAPLRLQATAVGFKEFNSQIYSVSPNSSADEIFFSLAVSNPNSGTARNVRVQIVSSDPAVIPYVDFQAYGDLPGGSTLRVTGTQYKDFLNSVSLALDRRSASGRSRVSFSLKVSSENAPETTIPLELGL